MYTSRSSYGEKYTATLTRDGSTSAWTGGYLYDGDVFTVTAPAWTGTSTRYGGLAFNIVYSGYKAGSDSQLPNWYWTQDANIVMPSWDLGTTNEDSTADDGCDVYVNITDPDSVGWFVMLTAISGPFDENNFEDYIIYANVAGGAASNVIDMDPTGNIPDTTHTLSGVGDERINIWTSSYNLGCDVSFTLTLCNSTGSYLQSCIFYWPGHQEPYFTGLNP